MCPKRGGVGDGGRSLIQTTEGQHTSLVNQSVNPEPNVSRAGNDIEVEGTNVNSEPNPEPNISKAGNDLEIGDVNTNSVEDSSTIPVSNEIEEINTNSA